MAPPQQKLSLTDFYSWEEAQEDRHEFYRGEVFAMAGGSRAHADVCGNVFAALKSAVKGTPCRAYTDAATLQVLSDMVFYQDALVTCDADDLSSTRVIRNPSLLVEVLSPSTEAFNRGLKFAAYRQIVGLKEYLLIDPERRTVEIYRRIEQDVWEFHDLSGSDALHLLVSIDLHMPMADVFDGVEAPAV
jgi:Uma2 family endonuclease